MTLSVHQEHDRYGDREDFIETGRIAYPAQHGRDAYERIEYDSIEHTCLEPMRGWTVANKQRDDLTGRVYESTHTHHGFCLLDKGHKGRHATVVFGCDGCGKMFRGEPAAVHNEAGVQFCFMCSRGYW